MACKIHQLNSEWREDKKANYIKSVSQVCSSSRALVPSHLLIVCSYYSLMASSILSYVLGPIPVQSVNSALFPFPRHALREYNIHKKLDHPVSHVSSC